MIGVRFGRWTVKRWSHRSKWRKHMFVAECDCGETRTVLGSYLRAGRSRDCGCGRIETMSMLRRTHGMRRSPEYLAWEGMRLRCRPSDPARKHYFDRGISVCSEWQESFVAFYEHIGSHPGAGYSLDRIDNDGNYEPGNVRWATIIEQANNKTTSRFIVVDGESMTIANAARKTGVNATLIHSRLGRNWPESAAALLPPGSTNPANEATP
tara:strand:- start:116 stop:745 length:630 start_codon:yes stop_codon:yes gene_type:complete